MNSKEIMQMKPGIEMDKHIAAAMMKITDENIPIKPFSTDPISALELREFVADCCGPVGMIRDELGPVLLQEFCAIRDEDEDNDSFTVSVRTTEWKEALCKAFLLFHHGHFGDYLDANYQDAMDKAPKQYPN